MWWVAWSVDARVLVSWTLDVGDSPRAGQEEWTFDDVLLPATRGLTQEEVTALQRGYDQESGQPEREGPDEADWEVFTIPRTEARHRLLKALRRLIELRIVEGAGGSVRHLHTDLLLRGLSSTTLSCPAYIIRFRYLGKEHRVVLNGQDADVVGGEMPLSVGRVVIVLLIVGAVLIFGVVLLASLAV